MKEANRPITWLAVFAIAVITVACQQPVAPTDPEPEPPKPTLLGTWEHVEEHVDDDGDAYTVTARLVFSPSGKAFWHSAEFEISGEDHHTPYGHIADWSHTDTTITKTFDYYDDDAGQWKSATIEKEYYLIGSGNELFVHHWNSEEKEDSFERYARVQDPVPANPSLLGTWERDGVQWDDGPVGKTRVTLTFTEDRWIFVETPLDEAGEVTDYWPHSGAWEPATESSVTKTFVAERHRDDDGTWNIEEISFDKHYAWGSGGELFVIEWRGTWEDEGDRGDPSIERYRRVENPLPSLEGVWVTASEGWERDDRLFVNRVTLTIGEEFTWLSEEELDGAFVLSFSVSGSWRHDESKQFVLLDMPDAVITAPGWSPEAVDLWTREHKGHPFRLAYASAGAPDRMVIASWHREQTYDDATNTWADSEVTPHGRYHWPFVKQP